jgi:hypothetical protein
MIEGINISPWMSEEEIEFLSSFLSPEDSMLEWGCGGSTLTFSKMVKEYHSIEHNQSWYKEIKNYLKNDKNITMHHVPADIIRGGKVFSAKYDEFVTYINYAQVINKKFDKVLIDGRGRQWCAEKILDYLNPDAIVFLHDFGVRGRERYNSVLNYYTVIGKAGTLVALKKS